MSLLGSYSSLLLEFSGDFDKEAHSFISSAILNLCLKQLMKREPTFQVPYVNKMAVHMDKIHKALEFEILAKCSTTKARTAILTLPHHKVETPVFMPVGTQGTMKGLTCKQLEDLDCQIILGNTYHLGLRPVRYTIYMHL